MQFGKYKLEQATDESIEDLGWTVFIARKCKERRVQLESVKIKKQMETSFENFLRRQKQSNHTNKTQFSFIYVINPPWVISCSCL